MEKVHRIIKSNPKDWLKPCIKMKTERKKAKHNLEKDFFKQMDNAVFEKTMENVRKN